MREHLTETILEHYGGSCTDNASDALKECRITFDLIMQSLPQNRNCSYGYLRRLIQLGDPFHIDNIVVCDVSKSAFGTIERDDHRQNHHLQLCQDLYDFVSKNKILSQSIMDKVLEGTGSKLIVSPKRQRDQRWLANQRNCLWIRIAMETMTAKGEKALVAWATSLLQNKLSKLGRTIMNDVLRLLLMLPILISVHFEAELGQYFEITTFWHAQLGKSKRPGFRMLDIHTLYLDFCIPFWNKSLDKPEEVFPETYAFMNSVRDEEVIQLKKEQFKYGLEHGRMKLIDKLSEFLFVPPLCFLILLNENIGSTVFRSMIPILNVTYAMIGEDWGAYNPSNESEKAWHELFLLLTDNLLHFFGQLGLARPWDTEDREVPALRQELMNLSNYHPTQQTGQYNLRNRSTPDQRYPILHEALEAVFGLFPSNSRIGEQGHGKLRYADRLGATLLRGDAELAYMFDFFSENDKIRKFLRRKKNTKLQPKDKLFKGVQCSTKAFTSTSLYETKELCMMHANAALNLSDKYARIDKRVMKQVSVKNDVIRKGGMSQKDKSLKTKVVQKAESDRTKMRRRPKSTIDDFSEDVQKATIKYDSEFERIDYHERVCREEIESLSQISFWKNLHVGKDNYYSEVEAVLPRFYEYYKIQLATKRSKTAWNKLIQDFLDKVNAIAIDRSTNVTCPFSQPPIDLSRLDKWEG